MNFIPLAISVLTRLLTALLSEKVLINMTVILASWIAKRTDNRLDDQLVQALKDGVSQRQDGRPTGHLYARVDAATAPNQ